ncbi:MAG TPA: glycine betaine ABC transporter substrate-binding protein, partial [Oligoflexia bacterium]|nr:glycine betaine ABC transporter substrate-binding protein [Oligoflexia bacterium]
MELNFKGSTLYAALLFGLTFFFGFTPLYANSFTVGSKVFTENYILAEIIAQTMESEIKNRQRSESVDRKIGLGGTGIVYQALLAREIDVYPEYTGTISEEILKQPQLKNINDLKTALETKGLTISLPLGFNNTYAIATSRRFAEEHDLKNISDLKKVPRARFGISYEFAQRKDGYYAMLSHYKMKDFFVRRMEHSLAYEALAANK